MTHFIAPRPRTTSLRLASLLAIVPAALLFSCGDVDPDHQNDPDPAQVDLHEILPVDQVDHLSVQEILATTGEDDASVHPNPYGPGQVTLAPWLRVVDDFVASLESIEAHRLVFTRDHETLEELEGGFVLVYNHPDDGFIRRVTDLEFTEHQVLVSTTDAPIGAFLLDGELGAPLPSPDEADEDSFWHPDNDIGQQTFNLDLGLGGESKSEPTGSGHWASQGSWTASAGLSASFEHGFNVTSFTHQSHFHWAGSFTDWLPDYDLPAMCAEFASAQAHTYKEAATLHFLYRWGGSQNRHKYGTGGSVTMPWDDPRHKTQTREFSEAMYKFGEDPPSSSWNVDNVSGWSWDYKAYFPYRYSRTRTSVLNTVEQRIISQTPTTTWWRGRAENILNALENTYTSDNLNWLLEGPEILRTVCGGDTNLLSAGVGVDFQAKYEPAVTVGLNAGIEYGASTPSLWDAKEAGIQLGPTIRIPIFTGVVLFLENHAKVKFSLTQDAAFSITYSLGEQRIHVRNYGGFKYNNSTGFETVDYKDITGQNPKSQFWGCDDDECAPSGVRSANILTVGKTAEFAFGFALEPSIWGSLKVETFAGAKGKVRGEVAVGNEGGAYQGCLNASAKVGVGVYLKGSLELPGCDLDKCELSTGIDLFDSCDTDISSLQFCIDESVKMCQRRNNSGRTPRAASAGPTSSTVMADENSPGGANDIPGHYELDALYITRGNKRILPVEVEGLKAGQCTSERGTVERGCPELLWAADFTECDPEAWEDHVALIPNFDNFAVRFRENLEEGDILHIIRQAVPANEMNEDGLNCAASGNAHFAIGVMDPEGDMPATNPVAIGVYNSVQIRIDEEHLSGNMLSFDEDYWPVRNDDDTFGAWDEEANAPANP